MMKEFDKSLAVIIGINRYGNGIPPLLTAVNVAKHLAKILQEEHGYDVIILLDKDATRSKLNALLYETLPNAVGTNDRVLFYFAGHGIALDGDDGPAGYLLPQDVRLEDRQGYLPMDELHKAIVTLPCRHFLAIFDCCFAGAFRWSSTRDLRPLPEVIYRERYERFIQDPAWQVITSAAYDQRALDFLGNRFGVREQTGLHSPFAEAFFDALHGKGDVVPLAKNGQPAGDGIITATELYLYLRDHVETQTIDQHQRQTPSIWPLQKHDKGEYIFLVPGHELNLPPAPELTLANNPYRGLQPFEEEHKDLFFGRKKVIEALCARVVDHSFTVVVGASGTGKSSLVMAGLIPCLRKATDEQWHILPVIRFGESPLQTLTNVILKNGFSQNEPEKQFNDKLKKDAYKLAMVLAAWHFNNHDKKLLFVFDQFEDLITTCREESEREHFLNLLANAISTHAAWLRVVITIRSDFEPQLSIPGLNSFWKKGRFVVSPMTQDELREVIDGPASVRVLYFEPSNLVDQLINEVVQTPGALPLLSFTLSELYIMYLLRRDNNRVLTQEDYETLGGIVGSLHHRATEEYENLDQAHQSTLRRIMLRMVILEGSELARRRVPRSELVYTDALENQRVEKVIHSLTDARLIVAYQGSDGEPYVEPAHEELIRGWGELQKWIRASQEELPLQRRLTQAAKDWARAKKEKGLLWDKDPRLPQLKQIVISPDNWLNHVEKEFVTNSSKQKRMRLILLAASVTMVFMLLTISYISVVIQRKNAIERAKVAKSRQLAAQALSHLDDQLDLALLLSVEACRTDSTTYEARNSLLTTLQYKPHLTNFLHCQNNLVRSLAYSPNGHILASGSTTGKITLWNVTTHKSFRQLHIQHKENEWNNMVWSLAFSPDGKILASGIDNGTIILWDATTGKQLGQPLKGHKELVSSLAFSPDSKIIASGSNDDTIILWNVTTRQQFGNSLIGHRRNVTCLAFSHDGKILASGSTDTTIILWDVANQKHLGNSLIGHRRNVSCLTFSSDNKILVSASFDSTIILWDVNKQKQLHKPLIGHNSSLLGLMFSTNGQNLLSVGKDNNVILWDVSTRKIIRHLLNGNQRIEYNAVFSSNGESLASCINDSTIILWNFAAPYPLSQNLRSLSEQVTKVTFSPDARTLAFVKDDSIIAFWDINTQSRQRQIFTNHSEGIFDIAFSPDGKTLASCGGWGDRTIILWDVASNPRMIGQLVLNGYEEGWGCLSFSSDGKTLASGSLSGGTTFCMLWNILTHQPMGKPLTYNSWDGLVADVAFSPDGKTLASVTDQLGRITLWNLSSHWQVDQVMTYHDVSCLAFSPNGEFLASNNDANITLWNLHSLPWLPDPLIGHHDYVNCLAFCLDGKTLVSGSLDSTLILWDTQTRQQLGKSFTGHQSKIESLLFSPDGKTLVSCGNDGTVILWNMALKYWQAQACKIANRNLTIDEWRRYIGEDIPYRRTSDSLFIHSSFIEYGRKLAWGGNIKNAIKIFKRANELDHNLNLNPETEANKNAAQGLLERGERFTWQERYNDVLAVYEEAEKLDPNLDMGWRKKSAIARILIKEGEEFAKQGRIKDAIGAYEKAQKIDSTVIFSVEPWSNLCWWGSVWGYATDKHIIRACDRAVRFDSARIEIRARRGFARALAGDNKGAVEDFWAVKRRDNNDKNKWQYQNWIDTLRAGKNPFTPEYIKTLREQHE